MQYKKINSKTDALFCPVCHAKLPKGALFCHKCGSKIEPKGNSQEESAGSLDAVSDEDFLKAQKHLEVDSGVPECPEEVSSVRTKKHFPEQTEESASNASVTEEEYLEAQKLEQRLGKLSFGGSSGWFSGCGCDIFGIGILIDGVILWFIIKAYPVLAVFPIAVIVLICVILSARGKVRNLIKERKLTEAKSEISRLEVMWFVLILLQFCLFLMPFFVIKFG